VNRRPDLVGTDLLRAASSDLSSTWATPPPPRLPWTHRFSRRRLKLIAAFLAVDVIGGWALWHFVVAKQDSPVDAVRKVATLAGQGNWPAVYDSLCRADREQFSETDLASGGSAALAVLHGLANVKITSAHAVAVHLIGPLAVPAEQVVGTLVPTLGTPIPFTVTTVRELGGWRMCLSAGGYSAPSLGVDGVDG
jgi:hypothetical protein